MLPSEQALHEALMRQEELLAYIDRQEAAKFQVRFMHTSCSSDFFGSGFFFLNYYISLFLVLLM